MITSLLVLNGVLTILIVISILLQKSSSIGLGAYSGSNDSMFGAQGSATFLAKATFVLSIIFIINTLFLGYSFNKKSENTVLNSMDIPQAELDKNQNSLKILDKNISK